MVRFEGLHVVGTRVSILGYCTRIRLNPPVASRAVQVVAPSRLNCRHVIGSFGSTICSIRPIRQPALHLRYLQRDAMFSSSVIEMLSS